MAPELTLRPVTSENLRAVVSLSETLTESQARCLASNEFSVAQAHVSETAWMRAIYLGDEPIGFVMVDLDEDDVPEEDRPAVGLWRFMIGRPWQRRGYGTQVLNQLVSHFAGRGIRTLYTSVVLDEPEGPYAFYLKHGFTDTGKQDHGEQILRLLLPASSARPLRLPVVPRVALVTVWVDAMDPMRRFYRDVLGFLVKDDRGGYVEFENSGVRFALCERRVMREHSAEFRRPVHGQRFALAFRCETPGDVDEAYKLLLEHGVVGTAPPQDMPWNQRAALFADPEGNIHEIFADL
jgi:catechol 2,3-dioxygenase-like lactoylglutathione lyase family enzyme/GNAT superfamily N-acetyltransferase